MPVAEASAPLYGEYRSRGGRVVTMGMRAGAEIRRFPLGTFENGFAVLRPPPPIWGISLA